MFESKTSLAARLRNLETAEALAANERAAKADRKAKEETALLIERERLRFVRREIEAAELVAAKALEILRQPYGNCTPDDAAKLFSVAHNIGSSALGLPGASHSLEVSGLGAPPVNITTHLTYDATSYKVDQIEKQFLLEHDHPQKERLLREIETRQSEWDRRNGENGE
jgi:hypothetical protein